MTSNMLRALACFFMLLDHLWASLIPGNNWMTYLGRLAFPIFAFQISEGYFHTSDFRKYALRLFIFGLLSEIPFNLLYSSGMVYPFHQNVMFTLLLGLLSIRALDTARQNLCPKSILKALFIVAGCLLLSVVGFVDYSAMGVLTVILFYLLRDFPFARLAQFAAMVLLNIIVFDGMTIPVSLGSFSYDFPTQGFAVLALIPIWLYNGKKGRSSKALQYGFYAFYPVHLLILALIMIYR